MSTTTTTTTNSRVLRRHQDSNGSHRHSIKPEPVVLPIEGEEEDEEHPEHEEITIPENPPKEETTGLFGSWTGALNNRPKMTRWIIAGVILLFSFLGLIWYFFGERIMNYLKFNKTTTTTGTSENPIVRPPSYQEQSNNDDGLQILEHFPKDVQERVKSETDESLWPLVLELKANGFQVFGNAQCGYTKIQRRIFGGSTSKTRKAFEELFVECFPTNNNCVGIRAFPTWKHTPTGEVIEGFQEPDNLRKIIEQVKDKQKQQTTTITQPPQTIQVPPPTSIPSINPLPTTSIFVMSQQTTTTKPQQQQQEQPGFIDITEQEQPQQQQQTLPPLEEIKVEHVRGVTINPPPLDTPVLPNNPNQNFHPVDVSSLRLQQDPSRINNDLDPITKMSMTMHQVLQDALKQSNPGKLNNTSYESGTVMGNTKIDLAQDPFAPRNLPPRQYEHRQ